MNPADLISRLQSRLAVREAHQTIRHEKTNMKYLGFTDPEEKKILANGGNMHDVEALRNSRAKAKAPELLKQLQSGENPSMNRYEKDAVLALSVKSRPVAAPPALVAEKPAPAPAAPTPAPSPSSQARPSHGLQKAIASARGEKVSHGTPAVSTGLARAQEIHRQETEARRK